MKKLLWSLLAVSFALPVVAEETSQHRSAAHQARDQYRHPQQTLAFFEVKPTMTVVEIWPGGKAWYTEILAPLLKDNGKLYAAHFSKDSDTAYFTKNLAKFNEKMQSNPAVYGKVELTTLQPPKELNIAPKGTVDRVLTFRNVHNWMKHGQQQVVFQAMYEALKTGGVLGIVEHRLPAKQTQDPKALSGYVTEEVVIKLAESVGFKLTGKSEINANPKDVANYPKGVWSLPPSLKEGEQNKQKYLSIGESDRMTLKFVKE